MPEPEVFHAPPGMVAVTSPGSIRVETALALLEANRQCEKAGLPVAFVHFGGSLVDKARNDACRTMLAAGHAWCLFIDGDMVFAPDAILKLVKTAYMDTPWADVVGAWCCLRVGAVPTIDTGTGTWESHFPGSGTMEVIRTGAAFLLVKNHVCQKFPQPWFACRHPLRWLDALAEVDNFARITFHGSNPFRGEAWEQLVEKAKMDPQSAAPVAGFEVGEDSGFCDRVKAAGMRIAVNTDIEIGHVDSVVLNGASHKAKMDAHMQEQRLCLGVLR